MFKHLPADYRDNQTARCRVSPSQFKSLGVKVGQWVLLRSSDSNQTDLIYGRVWPARYDCQESILVDRYITRSIPQEGHHSLKEAQYSTYVTTNLIKNSQGDALSLYSPV
jgi:hypothetical protein